METSLQHSRPKELGFAGPALDEVVAYAIQHESTMKRDIAEALADGHFAEPWPICKTIGPVKNREDPAGLILRRGQIAASWGDVERVDMTFSVSKSYLALCAGIAVDDGLIRDVHEPVRVLVDDGGFDGDQNREITWAQLLQLTSEWEGTLWDKPDWIDHNRDLSARPGQAGEKGIKRQMLKPGAHWEYNDVRVNRLSLALMRVFRRPLPEVLKERIMDPIGASDTWQWHGYENSYVEIDGTKMQSVSGGAHWGGELWISALDQARTGLLLLNDGNWEGRQIVSKDWIASCRTPCDLNEGYGYMWWLNTGRKLFPAASADSFFFLGVVANLVWVEPESEMIVVARWLQKERINGFAEKVVQALE